MRRKTPAVERFAGEAEAVILRLGAQGDGVAEIEGRPVHVPLTAVGDRVRLVYNGTRGRVLAVLAQARERVTPPCPHFGACGGCALQHIPETDYRAFKVESLRETLAQRGFADPPLAPLTVIPPRTRRRATFAFHVAQEAAALGFFRAQTRDVLDLQGCLLVTPAIETALPGLRALLAAHLPEGATGRLHVTATDSGLDADLSAITLTRTQLDGLIAGASKLNLARLTLDGADLALWRRPVIRIGGMGVALPPGAFLQPSAQGEAVLQDWVREGAGKARRIADLFCGLGTFALPLARDAQIHAIDFDQELLDALAGAGKTPGLKPITVERRDLLRNPVPATTLAKFEAVIFDPPRAGARAQVQAIAAAQVSRIVAVSCNAATLARDARHLCDAGYRLDWVRPLDQFLWSAHIEAVALFTRDRKR